MSPRSSLIVQGWMKFTPLRTVHRSEVDDRMAFGFEL